MEEPIPIVVDDRERRASVLEELDRSGVFDIHIERLDLGDYLVDGRFLFERKTLADLVASMLQGGLFKQALRLTEARHCAAIILEGAAGESRGGHVRWEAIQGALITVTLFCGVPLLRTRTAAETVRTMRFVARQGRTFATGVLPRRGRRPRGKRARQLYILQGLTGVGPEKARRLLSHFASVAAVMQADQGELRAVPGVGRQLALALRGAVNEPRGDYGLLPDGNR